MHQRVFTDVSGSSMANSVLEVKEAQPSKSFERTLAPRSPLAAGGWNWGMGVQRGSVFLEIKMQWKRVKGGKKENAWVCTVYVDRVYT